jgi:excisionase family DNA binding protein
MSNLQVEDAPLAISVKSAAGRMGISTKTLYRMYDAKQIEFVKLRGRTLVPVREIDRIMGPKQTTVGEPVVEPKKFRVEKIKLVPQLT